MKPSLLYIAFLCIVSALAPYCAAESRSVEEMLDNLTNGGRNGASSDSSARARAAVDKLSGEIDASTAARTVPNAPRARIEHYRLAGGVPFPSPEQVVLVPFEPMSQEAYDRIIARSLIRATYTPADKPKKCLYDRTTYVEGNGGSREKLLSDSLYISKKLVPHDSTDAFGSGAVLYTYGDEDDQTMYDILKTSAVPCVPYRIRIVSNGRFLDEGKNALRNYSKQQSGKGEVHPSIAVQLGLTK